MAAITVLASAKRTAGTTVVGAAVDSSAATTINLTLSGVPTPMGPGRIHCTIQTSADASVWNTVSTTVWSTHSTTGPEALPSSTTLDLPPFLAQAWVRAVLEVEPGHDWTFAVSGTAA
jgi:hypothetical protein